MVSASQPLTAWILVTFAVTAFTVGVPLLIGLLSYRRAAREGRERDVAALVTPIISMLIKLHNEERYAHPDALSRFVTLDVFNASMGTIRTDIGLVRTLIEDNEQRRREDVATVRDELRQNVVSIREEFRELKSNVAKAVGGEKKL